LEEILSSIIFLQIQGPHAWTQVFPTEKFQTHFHADMGQIIEKLHAEVPHTLRDDNRGAKISQQETILVPCTSAIFLNASLRAPSFCAQFLNNR